MADQRSIYDDGSIRSSNSRIYRAYSKARNTGGYIGRSTAGVGKELYTDLLGANAPEIVQSHKQAAILGLLGGPVASHLLQESYKKLKPTLSNAFSKIKGMRVGGGGYGDMGNDILMDESIDPNIDDESMIDSSTRSYSKKAKALPKLENIEETYIDRDGSRRKRRVTVRNSGKKQTVIYRELINTDSKGVSQNKKSRSTGSEEIVKKSAVAPKSVDPDLGTKVPGGEELTKKDYAFITYLAKSITAKLEKNERRKRDFSEKVAYGIKKLAIQVLPSIPVLKTSKYYSRLPNPARVGVMNSINSTLGMIYAAIRGTQAETNRLLYSIANINKLGFGITARIPKPVDVESLTELAGAFIRGGVSGVASLPFRLLKMGKFAPSPSTPAGYRKDTPGVKGPKSLGETMESMMGSMMRGTGKVLTSPIMNVLMMASLASTIGGGGALPAAISKMLPAMLGGGAGAAGWGMPALMGGAGMAGYYGLKSLWKKGRAGGNNKSGNMMDKVKWMFGFGGGGEEEKETQNVQIDGSTGTLRHRGMNLKTSISNDTIAIVQSINSIHAYLEAKFGALKEVQKKEYWKIRERRDSEMLRYLIKENVEAGRERKWSLMERMLSMPFYAKALAAIAGIGGMGLAAIKWGDFGNFGEQFQEAIDDPKKFAKDSAAHGIGRKVPGMIGNMLSRSIKMGDIKKGFSKSLREVAKKFKLGALEEIPSAARGMKTAGKSLLKKGALKTLGPLGSVADVGIGMAQGETLGESGIRVGTSMIGGAIGGGIGALGGGILAVPGMMIGSIIGDMFGKFLGSLFGPALDDAIASFNIGDKIGSLLFPVKEKMFKISMWVSDQIEKAQSLISTIIGVIVPAIISPFGNMAGILRIIVSKMPDRFLPGNKEQTLKDLDGIIGTVEGYKNFSNLAGESVISGNKQHRDMYESIKKDETDDFYSKNARFMSESKIETLLNDKDLNLSTETRATLQAEQQKRITDFNTQANESVDTSAINPLKVEMSSQFVSNQANQAKRNADKARRRGIVTSGETGGMGATGGINAEGGSGFKFSDFEGVKLTDGQKFAMIKEGFSSTPYWDVDGYSIGFGHKMKPGENWTNINKEDAIRLFLSDYDSHSEAFIRRFPKGVWESLTPGRQTALLDLAFNMGPGWMEQKWGGALEKYILPGDWDGFYRSLKNSKYIKQVGERGHIIAEAIRTGVFNASNASLTTMYEDVKNKGASAYNYAKENAPGAWNATKEWTTGAYNESKTTATNLYNTYAKPYTDQAIETIKATGNDGQAKLMEFSNAISEYANEKTLGEASDDAKKAVVSKAIQLRERFGASVDEIIESSELDDKVKAMYAAESTQKAMAGVSTAVTSGLSSVGAGLKDMGSRITGMSNNVINHVSNVVSSGMGNSELTGKGIDNELISILVGDI